MPLTDKERIVLLKLLEYAKRGKSASANEIAKEIGVSNLLAVITLKSLVEKKYVVRRVTGAGATFYSPLVRARTPMKTLRRSLQSARKPLLTIAPGAVLGDRYELTEARARQQSLLRLLPISPQAESLFTPPVPISFISFSL